MKKPSRASNGFIAFLLKLTLTFIVAMLMVLAVLYKNRPEVFYYLISDTFKIIKISDSKKVLKTNGDVFTTSKSKDDVLPESKPFRNDSDDFIPKDVIKEKNMLAIIVDDGGYSVEFAKRVAALDLPLTWAILPGEVNSNNFIKIAKKNDIPFLIHFPMQAEIDKAPLKGAIGEGMSSEEIGALISGAFEEMPEAVGLNNHRGSLATSSKQIMEPVIDEIKSRSKIFVDSRTSSKSVAFDIAKKSKIRALINRGFLDGNADKKVIEDRFKEVVNLTLKNGYAIVICHFRPTTVEFLEELNKRKDEIGVRLVTIPEMAKIMYKSQKQKE